MFYLHHGSHLNLIPNQHNRLVTQPFASCITTLRSNLALIPHHSNSLHWKIHPTSHHQPPGSQPSQQPSHLSLPLCNFQRYVCPCLSRYGILWTTCPFVGNTSRPKPNRVHRTTCPIVGILEIQHQACPHDLSTAMEKPYCSHHSYSNHASFKSRPSGLHLEPSNLHLIYSITNHCCHHNLHLSYLCK